MKKALCIGSVAFDIVMDIFPALREEIPLVDGKITALNLALVSPKGPEYRRGGTGGNIAFGIGFLGAPAVLFSAVGHDFNPDYITALNSLGVESGAEVFTSEFTAHCYMITDPRKEQIIIWQPNAASHMEEISVSKSFTKEQLDEIAVAIYSPGTALSTLKHMKEVKDLNPNIVNIFDPGQMVMTYTEEQFIEALKMSDIIIINDAEVLKARTRGLFKESLHKDFPQLMLIETKGADGAFYYLPDGSEWHVGVVPNSKFVDPTGAGDSFRSGLISAFLNGKSWVEAGKFGAAIASACISSLGGQSYGDIYTKEQIFETAKSVEVKKLK
jgi:adenosine kinase